MSVPGKCDAVRDCLRAAAARLGEPASSGDVHGSADRALDLLEALLHDRSAPAAATLGTATARGLAVDLLAVLLELNWCCHVHAGRGLAISAVASWAGAPAHWPVNHHDVVQAVEDACVTALQTPWRLSSSPEQAFDWALEHTRALIHVVRAAHGQGDRLWQMGIARSSAGAVNVVFALSAS